MKETGKKEVESDNIVWSEELKTNYVYHVNKKKAHLKEKGDKRTFEEKHQQVINTMFSLHLFPGRTIDSIKADSCYKAFNRWMKAVKDKAAVDKEGANLSGLGEMTKLEKDLLKMSEEIAEKSANTKAELERIRKLNSQMLSFENKVMIGQGLSNSSGISSKSPVTASTTSTVTTASDSDGQIEDEFKLSLMTDRKYQEVLIENALKDNKRKAEEHDLQMEERRARLKHDEMMANLLKRLVDKLD